MKWNRILLQIRSDMNTGKEKVLGIIISISNNLIIEYVYIYVKGFLDNIYLWAFSTFLVLYTLTYKLVIVYQKFLVTSVNIFGVFE